MTLSNDTIFKEIMQMLPSEKAYEINKNKDINLKYVFKTIANGERVKNCPFDVPKSFAEFAPKTQAPRTSRYNPLFTYHELAKEMFKGTVTNKTLQKSCQRFINKKTVLFMLKDNKIRAFEGRAKGTKYYADETRDKIKTHAEKAKLLKPCTYFLTLTQKVTPGKTNIVKQYSYFGDNLKVLLDKMVRKYGVMYEQVSEATSNGYRHSHIVLHFDKYFKKEILRKNGNAYTVCNGELKSFIKKHWSLGMSKLERSSKRSPIYYLLKYVSKNAYSDFNKLANENYELSKEDRKNLLTMFGSICSQTRQFSLSQFSKVEEEKIEKIKETKENKENRTAVENGRAENAAGGLDWSSINFTLPCKKDIRIMLFSKYKERVGTDVKDFDKLNKEQQLKIWKDATPIGCQGCIISHIANKLANGFDGWVDVEYKKGKNRIETLFEYYF